MARDASANSRRGAGPLAVLLLGQFLANVDTAVVNVAAPSIQSDLHASAGEVDLIVAGYILTYAVLLVTGARLGDIYGYRRVFLAGLSGFIVTSLACGVATGAVPLIGARLAQGGAAALMVPQVLNGIQLHFTGEARARAVGCYTLALSGGAIVGQVLGGLLVTANILGTGWRPIFLINVPIGVLLVLAGVRLLPPDLPGRRTNLDVHGAAALTTAVSFAVLPLVLGRDLGWPRWSWLVLAAGVGAFIWFVRTERKVLADGRRPLINLAVVTRPRIRWALAAHGLTTLTYLALLFVLALYLQHGLGRSPARSGLAMVAWVAAFGLAGPILPRLSRARQRFAPTAGCLILTAAYAVVSVLTHYGAEDGALVLAVLAVGGFGLGVSSSSLISHLTDSVTAHHASDLSGAINTNAQLSGVVGVALFGSLYPGLVQRPGTDTATSAFALITAVFALLALVAAVAAYRATRPQRGDHHRFGTKRHLDGINGSTAEVPDESRWPHRRSWAATAAAPNWCDDNAGIDLDPGGGQASVGE